MGVLIDSQTIAKANFESANVVVTSPTFTNSGLLGDRDSVRIFVDYEAFDPDGDQTPGVDSVQAVLEEQVDGTWLAVATQDQEVRAEPSRRQQVLIYGPAFVDAGQNTVVLQAGVDQIFQSRHQGRLTNAATFRVRIYLKKNSVDLDEITLSITEQRYNFQG